MAAEVFKEFERQYREAAASSPIPPNAGRSTEALRTPVFKPLTAFCGTPRDVEPLTILLLKVLCDLRKLEEMRFLFTQCMLELEGQQPPSVELFNVYLLAVSMTDTFNENELENMIELMRVKGTQPDIVTKLSVFMLYIRLGKEERVGAWWPLLREEVKSLIAAETVAQYPLLGSRLQHCFQILVRLHVDTTAMRECFELLKTVSPGRCTPSLLVPYMVLSVANQAMPPAAVVELLQMLEAGCRSAPAANRGTESGDTIEPLPDAATDATDATEPPSAPPALSSEVTAFRLLAKCARWKDAASAEYVRAYIRRYSSSAPIIAPENAPTAALLYVAALAQAGRPVDALAVVEAEVPAPLNVPGDRPKFFLESRRMTLLPTDPLMDLLHSITKDGGDGVDAVLGELRARTRASASDGSASLVVTAVSLDLVMAACAELEDPIRAEHLLGLYSAVFNASPGPYTYTTLLRCYSGSEATATATGVSRVRALLRAGGELAEAGVPLTAAILRAALEVTLVARDIEAALFVVGLHVEAGASIDVRQGSRLLRELSLLADADGAQRVLQAMRSSVPAADQPSLDQFVAKLKLA